MRIRRIVVGLDSAPQGRRALAAAALLAGALDAELEALLVESDELHRLAGLPFAREVGTSSAAARRIDPAALARALQAQAREARHALARLAAPRAVRWTLRVTRGEATSELVAASAQADLTVVGIPRWGPEAMRLARDAPVSLLVLPGSGRYSGPLVAIVPVAIAPERALAVLDPIAGAVGDGLTLLAIADDLAAAGPWCAKAGDLLRRQGRRAQIEIVREGQPEALQAALERLAPRAVAILAFPALPEG